MQETQATTALSRPLETVADITFAATAVLERLRARAPKVHCITNSVAQNFTANALLALGAIPSMTLSPEEIGPFVARSDALLVNLGTFGKERREATSIAVDTAMQGKIPWVLDPVFVDRAPARAAYARDLLFLQPSSVRLNAAEFSALAETSAEPGDIKAYARERHAAIGLSGARDLIVDCSRVMSIDNGHPFMARVTAMGCAVSAMVAACLAVEKDAWLASAAAMLIAGVAGEMAAERSRGPGSFGIAVLDALHLIDGDEIEARARISIMSSMQ